MSEKLIKSIHVNFYFMECYQLAYSFIDILNLLFNLGCRLVRVYRQHFQDNILSWADFLFINPEYKG